MMKVFVQKISGRKLSSRSEGKVMRHYLLDHWKDDDILEIDFEGMDVASVSFMDEAFGKILDHYSLDEMKVKLKFVGLDKEDRALLNYIVLSRYKENKKLSA